MLHLRADSLTAHKQVLFQGIDLRIQAGERVVILGASGAGKTTLLTALYKEAGSNAALIPQPHGLVGPLSTAHNVALGRIDQMALWRNLRSLLWMPAAEKKRVEQCLADVDLSAQFAQAVDTLSGGEQSRTAIARALYRKSPLLLADEPCAALDPERARSILQALRDQFSTIVCTMHDVQAGLELATRVIGVADRAIDFDLPVAEVTSEHLEKLYGAEVVNGQVDAPAQPMLDDPLESMPRSCL